MNDTIILLFWAKRCIEKVSFVINFSPFGQLRSFKGRAPSRGGAGTFGPDTYARGGGYRDLILFKNPKVHGYFWSTLSSLFLALRPAF